MVCGWKDDGTANFENDEGSNGATDPELVDDKRTFPLQNSNPNQVDVVCCSNLIGVRNKIED